MKSDLFLQCCKTKYLENQVQHVVTRSATFAYMLVVFERQYPSYETDLSLRAEIQNLAVLPNNSKPARISELLADLDHWMGRLTPGSYGDHELLFWLVAHQNAPGRLARPTRPRRARTRTHTHTHGTRAWRPPT